MKTRRNKKKKTRVTRLPAVRLFVQRILLGHKGPLLRAMEDQGRNQGTRSEAERQTWPVSGLAGMQALEASWSRD